MATDGHREQVLGIAEQFRRYRPDTPDVRRAPYLTDDEFESVIAALDAFADDWVPSGECTEAQIAMARACGDMVVSPAGFGWIRNRRAGTEASAEREPEWQPIESAPKDGERFLGADADGEVTICHWDKDEGYEAWRDDEWERLECAPIHWCRLPPAPARTEEATNDG